MAEIIQLFNMQANGDVVCLTAAIRDLHLAYPFRFDTWYDGVARELFEHHPLVKIGPSPTGAKRVKVEVSSKRWGDRVQFLPLWHEELGQQLGIGIPVTRFAGDLFLSESERTERPIDDPYWVYFAGSQTSATIKASAPADQQRIVDHFRGRIQFVQLGLAGQFNQPLRGATNRIGQTGHRDLMRLVYHASGVLCAVSFGMHLAAAFDRPCVVNGGGFEHPYFYGYPGHRIVHTIGSLDCCYRGACWKRDVKRDCARPVKLADGQGLAAHCMTDTSSEIIQAIEQITGVNNGR